MPSNIQVRDAGNNTVTISTIDALMVDGAQPTIGTMSDEKSDSTDSTPVTAMAVWKQISASIQDIAASTLTRDNEGNAINPKDYSQSLSYNSDGTVESVSFTDGTFTWTQTFSYESGKLTAITNWIKS